MISYKEQIEAVAPYANLNPRAAGIIQRFFLEVATQAEKDELDEWLNESLANERLFDLLIMATRGGVGAGILKLIIDLTKKEPVKKKRINKWVKWIGIGLLLVIVVDEIIPSHPIWRWMNGGKLDFVTKTFEAGDQARVVWLPDSTRIELQPHSKLGYSTRWYWYERKVRLTGSAGFDIMPSKDGPFTIIAGEMKISLPKGAFTLLGESGKPVVLQQKP